MDRPQEHDERRETVQGEYQQDALAAICPAGQTRSDGTIIGFHSGTDWDFSGLAAEEERRNAFSAAFHRQPCIISELVVIASNDDLATYANWLCRFKRIASQSGLVGFDVEGANFAMEKRHITDKKRDG